MKSTIVTVKASELRDGSRIVHDGMHKIVDGNPQKTKLSLIIQVKDQIDGLRHDRASRVVLRQNDDVRLWA